MYEMFIAIIVKAPSSYCTMFSLVVSQLGVKNELAGLNLTQEAA